MLVVLLAVGGLIAWLSSDTSTGLADRDNWIGVAFYIVWLAVLVPSVLLVRRYSGWAMLRDAAAWVGVAAVIAVGYSFRDEFRTVYQRVAGELMPNRGVQVGGHAVAFRAAENGHFHLEAAIDGVKLHFMVDTGASDVVLSERDARRLGLDPTKLAYTRTYRTANGVVQGAPVTLSEVRIGPIVLHRVEGSVNRGQMGVSLLGQSFLNRLSGYSVENGVLTLRQ
jgi:aspartyl protease family protein